jgi:hypothetical protein
MSPSTAVASSRSRRTPGGRFAGDAITIVGDHGNTFFYKHGVSNVKVGDGCTRPKIGTSGSAAAQRTARRSPATRSP